MILKVKVEKEAPRRQSSKDEVKFLRFHKKSYEKKLKHKGKLDLEKCKKKVKTKELELKKIEKELKSENATQKQKADGQSKKEGRNSVKNFISKTCPSGFRWKDST